MNGDGSGDRPGSRDSPVGAPVVRGSEAIAGSHADEAVQFDPDDPDALGRAAEVVRTFTERSATDDNLVVLRGAAACATLVRGEGSYTAAAERAGSDVTVAFVRKWARVHDLPRPVRKHVATGAIAPTAAKHIARVSGSDRYDLAWATLDHDLTVREVRSIASDVTDGRPIETALRDHDIEYGSVTLSLPTDVYRDLRHRAGSEGIEPSEVVERALGEFLGD